MATTIAWADEVWNVATGCSHASEGCRHCYAETLSLRRGWTAVPWTAANAAVNVVEHPERLSKPTRTRPAVGRPPWRFFACSMGDLFHEQVSDDFLRRAFAVMAETSWHSYLVLTKRIARAATWPGPWPPHVWLGVSIEDRKALGRLDVLRASGARVRFVSAEPLLEDLGPLDLSGIDWLIAGGESGPGFRPMYHAWARALRDQCVAQGTAFFFKQGAARLPGRGDLLEEADGSRTRWHQWPDERRPPEVVR